MYAVKIYHAKQPEEGGTHGSIVGDSGKEIIADKWYLKGWVYYVECLDEAMADRAVEFAKQIVENQNYGYSQDDRWTGYDAIIANGGVIAGARGSFDCASMVITVYILAGLKTAATGYTGNLKTKLEATGKFKVYTDAAHTQSCNYAKKGSLYIRPKTSTSGGHVFIVAENGTNVKPAAKPESQLKPPYVKVLKNVWIRTGDSTKATKLVIAHNGDVFPFLGKAPSNWYKIFYKGREAYISNRADLTRLIT